MNDEMKKKVIVYIDYLLERGWNETAFRIDLNNLRSKYIFKDISLNEFKKDINWLGDLRRLDQLRNGVKLKMKSIL